MSEQPPQSWLERLLAAEADQAIADGLDLWPGISQRLRERGPDYRSPFTANGAVDARDLRTMRGDKRPLPFAARVRQRSRELIGAAITLGLSALVIALFALIVGPPDGHWGQVGFGNDLPEQIIPAAASPGAGRSVLSDGEGPMPTATPQSGDPSLAETEPRIVAGPDCTFDLDVSLETGADSLEVKVWARSNWACADTGTLRLTVIDASGRRAEIAGNPLTLPLTAEGLERHTDSTVLWSNWCGERERFRIETSFGDEQRTHALPDAPRCVDQKRPSALRMSELGAGTANPAMPVTQGTPVS